MSVTEYTDVVNGRNGYKARDVDFVWLVGVGLHIGFKWRRIWVREEVKCVNVNGSKSSKKKVENLTKIADQLPRYQVLLVLVKAASPPSTAVSHNSLTDSRLTRLMW